jgi:hypothetical protein
VLLGRGDALLSGLIICQSRRAVRGRIPVGGERERGRDGMRRKEVERERDSRCCRGDPLGVYDDGDGKKKADILTRVSFHGQMYSIRTYESRCIPAS